MSAPGEPTCLRSCIGPRLRCPPTRRLCLLALRKAWWRLACSVSMMSRHEISANPSATHRPNRRLPEEISQGRVCPPKSRTDTEGPTTRPAEMHDEAGYSAVWRRCGALGVGSGAFAYTLDQT
ncbi:hypothetical protein Bbelb_407440 [Branchiostoma belcheri]|nr:hypothetical protein Bbelb_407440 [Branchiostoma belcheri]